MNDRFQNTTSREHAAVYLSALDAEALRGICDLNHIEPSDNRDKMIRRLVNDRHGLQVAPVAFTPPKQRRESGQQRSGRGRHYSEAERAGRIAFLDMIDRRCQAHNATCITNRATRTVTAYPLEEGQRAGQPVQFKVCSKHVGWFAHTGLYEVTDVQPLPPVTDEQKDEILARMRKERSEAQKAAGRRTDTSN